MNDIHALFKQLHACTLHCADPWTVREHTVIIVLCAQKERIFLAKWIFLWQSNTQFRADPNRLP